MIDIINSVFIFLIVVSAFSSLGTVRVFVISSLLIVLVAINRRED